jgi:peptidylprolyl isomerase
MSPRKSRKRRPRKRTSKRKDKSTSKSTGKKPIKLIIGVLAVFAVIIVVVGMYYMNGSSPVTVALQTSMGDIIIELREDMPITTGSFLGLIEQGVYDYTIFHRVIDGFMIQGGDPTGSGYGDPTIPAIPDEFIGINENKRGTIAMANSGPNTGSTQFFINLVNNAHLNLNHPVFGKVVDGMDVVDQIAKVQTDSNNVPIQEVRIITANIVE